MLGQDGPCSLIVKKKKNSLSTQFTNYACSINREMLPTDECKHTIKRKWFSQGFPMLTFSEMFICF